MTRALILVEGQTEETFVTELLAPHLAQRDIHIRATILTTKRVKQGPNFKGGVTSYAKVRNDLHRLLGDTNAVLITTMLDYYGLPDDFPGVGNRPAGSGFQRVAHVEQAFRDDIGNRRFLPYLALHEFEAMLFSAPGEISEAFPDIDVSNQLRRIRDQYGSPEEIDEQEPPSRQLLHLIRSYKKTIYGPIVTAEIGLATIRGQCAHFNAWLKRLEALAE